MAEGMEIAEPSRHWIKRNLKIINKSGTLVELIPNEGQLMLHRAIEEQRKSGYPVRIILLKPRQVGWSTWCEAEGFWYINQFPNKTALVVSADIKSTRFVFNMSKLFQDMLPKEMKRKTVSSTEHSIIYAQPHRSKFLTQTAGTDVLGRGGTVNFFHGSEVAYWPSAKLGLAAVLQMVPYEIDTTVILESTANGVGGAFYDLFWQAVDRQKDGANLAGFIPVFFPWYKFSEYKTTVPMTFKADEDELDLKQKFVLTDEQIYWRRLKLSELGGDEEMFRQEYPATPMEAFIASGNPVFTGKMTSQKIIDRIRYCIFTENGIEDVNRRFNCWQIIRNPIEGHEYAMGIDTMESRISDPQDEKSQLDRDGVAVLDRDTSEYVAIYHGQTEQVELGQQCLYCARYYNNAYVAPEIPKAMEVLKIFRNAGYSHIYERQIHDEQLIEDESDNLGWKTTMVTRKWLVDSFITALREGLIINFPVLLDEMKSFIYDKIGKPIHMPGKHDDILFGAMIALQAHLRCPYKPKPYKFSTTFDYDEKRVASINEDGFIDTGIEDTEEEVSERTV